MKKKFKPNTTQLIMLSFLAAILIGTLLLALPISSASGHAVPFLDALFTATSATCVTGLVTLPVHSTWSIFGQIVILILIQIGGLGIITIFTGIMVTMRQRIGIRRRIILQDSFNLNSLTGLVTFTKKVILGTFIVEGMGALLCMPVFVPQFGPRGIWVSFFHSISAFCNAGIDIIGDSSLYDYVTNPLINGVTCTLIILSGIGFIVWWDVVQVAKNAKTKGIRCLQGLALHSKIALSATAILLVLGALLILMFEYSNPDTLGNYPFLQKLQIAFFQSVTTRTAGFATIPQENLTNPSALLCLLLMFIGGSPVGTAGGIKTVTFVVLVTSMAATVKGREEVVLFNRNIPRSAVNKAVAVTSMSFLILFLSTVFLSVVTDANALDIAYEAVSATATVGLTRNLTSTLDGIGKLIIILTMYLGRVGPISLAIAFTTNTTNHNIIKNPTEEISVG